MILPSSKQQLRSTHGKRQANNLRQNNPHIVSLLLFYYFVEYTSPNLSIAYSPFLMNFPSCSKADVQKQEESNAYQYDHIFPQGPAPFHGHELQIGLHSHEGVVITSCLGYQENLLVCVILGQQYGHAMSSNNNPDTHVLPCYICRGPSIEPSLLANLIHRS